VPNVLIVHDDVAIQLWLAFALAAEGVVVIPAKTTSQASKLVARLELRVDLLVINPALAGAESLTNALRQSQGHLRALPITPASLSTSASEWVAVVRDGFSMAASA